MLLIYILLLITTGIYVSLKKAVIMAGIWLLGVFLILASGKGGSEAGYLLTAYQAIAGIYMAFLIHLKMNQGRENVSMTHTDEPFEFTPLDHEANDPRILSKHPIDGPDPEHRLHLPNGFHHWATRLSRRRRYPPRSRELPERIR